MGDENNCLEVRFDEIEDLNEVFHILLVKFCAGFIKDENV